MATTSTPPFSSAARSTSRPIRPPPLIPILTTMVASGGVDYSRENRLRRAKTQSTSATRRASATPHSKTNRVRRPVEQKRSSATELSNQWDHHRANELGTSPFDPGRGKFPRRPSALPRSADRHTVEAHEPVRPSDAAWLCRPATPRDGGSKGIAKQHGRCKHTRCGGRGKRATRTDESRCSVRDGEEGDDCKMRGRGLWRRALIKGRRTGRGGQCD